jgi:hypothetical protein
MVIATIEKLLVKGDKDAAEKTNLPGNGKRKHKGVNEIRETA